jgi:fido (protein-threonine AMPylation protein)
MVPELEDQDKNKNKTRDALVARDHAIKKKDSGNKEMAEKLFKRALELRPENPDILTAYGEFLEQRENYIDAYFNYKKALYFAPDHSQALENHKRTVPVVEELDEALLQNIQKMKESLFTNVEKKKDKIIERHDIITLSRLDIEIYHEYICQKNGAEGSKIVLPEVNFTFIPEKLQTCRSQIDQHEDPGIHEALNYIESALLPTDQHISENDILQIHKHVMADQGEHYRQTQVFIYFYTPPPPTKITLLMDDFIRWINSIDATSLHPIKYAALAHYKLTHIHPFRDGNGRTSRLLMNWILMRANYPLIIVRKEDPQYFETLKAAQLGDERPFIRKVNL